MDIRRAAALTGSEWADVARAQLALVEAQLLVWTQPAGRLLSRPRTPGAMPVSGANAAGAGERAIALRLARGVRRAAEHGLFRPRCLARSLALARLLERRGVPGVYVRVGVRREAGELRAHAWVEHRGRVIGDEPARVAAFAPLLDVRGTHAPR